MMNYKLSGLLISFFALQTLYGNAQEQKADSTKTIRISCGSGNYKNNKPLIIFNDREAAGFTFFHEHYFDMDNLDTPEILRGKKAIDAYGKKGENGVIIFRTKETIEWITSEEILRQMAMKSYCEPEKLMVKTDDRLLKNDTVYGKGLIAYFEKEFIKRIYIQDTDGVCTAIVLLKK